MKLLLVALHFVTGWAVVADAADRHQDRRSSWTIDADKLDRVPRNGVVIFSGNVIADFAGARVHADRMKVRFDELGQRISTATWTGTVRLTTSDCRTGTAGRAEYRSQDHSIVLRDNARMQEWDFIRGEDIFIRLPWTRPPKCPPPRPSEKRIELETAFSE